MPILVALSFPFLAKAQWNEFTCNENGNQQELNRCAQDEYNKANSNLNTIYKTQLSLLSETGRIQLRSAQGKWLKELKPHCQKVANDEAEGGSMWPMVYLSCMTNETNARTKEIKNFPR